MKSATPKKWTVITSGIYQSAKDPMKFKRYAAIAGTTKTGKKPQVVEVLTRSSEQDLNDFIRECQEWQLKTKRNLSKQTPDTAAKDSLLDCARRWIALESDKKKKADREDNLILPTCNALIDPQNPDRGTFGKLPIDKFTREHVLLLVARWQVEPSPMTKRPVGANTIKGRVSAIRQMFDTLPVCDGLTNPAPLNRRKLPLPKLPEPEPRDLLLEDAEAVLDAIPDYIRTRSGKLSDRLNESKIRLRIMLRTGLAPIGIGRLTPESFDLDGTQATLRDRVRSSHDALPHVFFPKREKGGGSPGCWMAVNPAAREAFQDFIDAHLFGPFSSQSMNQMWKRGIQDAAAAIENPTARRVFLSRLPPNCHAYDLRHTFATVALAAAVEADAAGDSRALEAVALMLQHVGTRMTKRYAQRALELVRRSVARKMAVAMPARNLRLVEPKKKQEIA